MAKNRRWVIWVLLATLAILALAMVVRRESFEGKDTIFVSVASYRDAECSSTVKELFDKADDPSRVFIGLCEQNSDDDKESCVPHKLPKNVRRVSIPHLEAKGPTYARYLCSTLYAGERWFMQIDSHTRMAQGWDTLAITNAMKCPSKKAILTHYPRTIEESDKGHKSVPVLCRSSFDGQGVPTFEAVIMDQPEDGKPKPVPFVSGGFVFAPGQAVVDVPFDPDLPHLFQGEEILHSARLWTSGYDFFTPLDNVCFHQYGRKDSPRFWNDVDAYGDVQNATMSKVRRLLGFEKPGLTGYRYGMGTERSLGEYWAFAGIDPLTKKTTSEAKFCK